MFNLSSNTKPQAISAKLGLKKALVKNFKIFVGILIIAAGVVFYFFIFSPAQEKIQAQQNEAATLNQAIAAKQQEFNAKQKELQDFSIIEKQNLAVLEKILPQGQNIPAMFLQLQDLVQKAGLEIKTVSAAKADLELKALSSGQVKKLVLDVEISGPSGYSGVKDLIDKIEKDMRFFNITAIDIEAEQPADFYADAFEKAQAKELKEYTLSLETYYLE